jgi:DNA helicase-2/ATP-dependent DNA helicase PcrA
MEEGLFPGRQTIDGGNAELEEERRLAYVAITRAKKTLYVVHTRNRLLYGQTMYNPVSRFVSEIPPELIEQPKEDTRIGFHVGAPSFGGSSYGGSTYGGSTSGGWGARGSVYGNRGAEAPASQKRTYYSASAPTPHAVERNRPASTSERATVGKPLVKKPTGGAKAQLAAGDRVRHMTFGEGEIISVRPMGADTLYEVVFEKVGTKKLMATYAKLTKI